VRVSRRYSVTDVAHGLRLACTLDAVAAVSRRRGTCTSQYSVMTADSTAGGMSPTGGLHSLSLAIHEVPRKLGASRLDVMRQRLPSRLR
jgi:hypothetical protein